jgi:hypothetical protein
MTHEELMKTLWNDPRFKEAAKSGQRFFDRGVLAAAKDCRITMYEGHFGSLLISHKAR